MTTQTRFYRTETHTVNGLFANQLGLTTSGTLDAIIFDASGHLPALDFYLQRVYVRTAAGVETTIGTNVANITQAPTASILVDRTWTPPATSLASTDNLCVREAIADGGNLAARLFTTEALGRTGLSNATWTVRRHITVVHFNDPSGTMGLFEFGAGFNSRIEGITFAAAGQAFTQTLSAAVRTPSSVTKAAGKRVVATVRATTVTVKQITKSLLVTVYTTGGVVKQAHIALTSIVPLSGTLTKQVAKTVTTVVTGTTSLAKWVFKALNATVRATASLTAEFAHVAREYFITLTAGVTPSVALTKRVVKVLGGTISVTGVAVKHVGKMISTTTTAAATVTKHAGKVVIAAARSAGVVAKHVQKAVGTSVLTTGSIIKQAGKVVIATIAATATISKYAQKLLSTSVAVTATISKYVSKAITAAVRTTALVLPWLLGQGLRRIRRLRGTIERVKRLLGRL